MATKTLTQENPFDRLTKIILGVGVILIVAILFFSNYKGNKPAEPTKNTDTQVEYRQEILDEGASTVALPMVYEVKSGDTLWSISETVYSSGFNWKNIQNANPQVDPKNLVVGMQLNIPAIDQLSAPAGTINSPSTTLTKITANEYVVVSGDNLWNISLRAYGDPYKWVELAKVNNLSNPSIIHRGNRLMIPR